MDVKNELFDEFIKWLKLDGLTPKKSERLWKKTIFSRLQNGHKRTLENWDDFMNDHFTKQLQNPITIDFDANCLIGLGVSVQGVHRTIDYVVKGETMCRVFFEDGKNMDVQNTILLQVLKDHEVSKR
ncbi:hypothetical protein [Sulfuricurvum sp.]|uniref:hypothetical protein n=1 Tax=Sulfuricurvum sp. TaxID=2025608 RepID=UPI003C3DFF75